MKKQVIGWKSEHLHREMKIGVYGHFGIILIMFPAFTDECEEPEKNGLMKVLSPMINSGKIKIYTVDTINHDSWLSEMQNGEESSRLHYAFNNFLIDELVPFVHEDCAGPIPMLTMGAHTGAFHAANTFFRRPDLFLGTIAVDGNYDIYHLTNGFFDDNCYFNSPVHYLPNLTDSYWLEFLTKRRHIYILSGSGENEYPHDSERLSNILGDKGITCNTQIWRPEYSRNWKSWNKIFHKIISENL